MEVSYAFICTIQLQLWLVEIKQRSVSGVADA
jgi:hypothetical protein